jgi:hypothetical protein
MSHFHLGLSWPTPADLTAGAEALNKADAATEKTPREAAYIRALRALYDNFKPENSWVYSQNYAEAMAQLGAAYPSDLEAKVFYALALILAQPADDVDLVETKQAVQVLTPLLQEYPDHPGYAIVQARFPTMFAIETHDWIAAAHSEPLMGDEGSGRSLTLLAHAIAAGHL